jgi:hypothetical protein
MEAKFYLKNLSAETIEYLIQLLITSLNKIENKSALKSRAINFIYTLCNYEITYRCCKLIENVFVMNWESIREKEKNMKKIMEKFVVWAIFWSVYELALIED